MAGCCAVGMDLAKTATCSADWPHPAKGISNPTVNDPKSKVLFIPTFPIRHCSSILGLSTAVPPVALALKHPALTPEWVRSETAGEP
jgi:hypothetical protein